MKIPGTTCYFDSRQISGGVPVVSARGLKPVAQRHQLIDLSLPSFGPYTIFALSKLWDYLRGDNSSSKLQFAHDLIIQSSIVRS